MTPSLYAANNRMESLKSNMKAVLMIPLVSSLELGWRTEDRGQTGDEGKVRGGEHDPVTATVCLTPALVLLSHVYLEVQQGVQLVLNHRQGLNQLLCVHGAHHTVGSGKQHRQRFMCRGKYWDFNIKWHGN